MIHDWAHTGPYWFVSQRPILLGHQFVHTVCVTLKLFVFGCVFLVSVEGLKEKKKRWKKTGEREGDGGIKAEQQKRGRWERHRQESMLSFSLSPSLPDSPTHTSKYCDHRKVISKLSQSEDNEPTESHEKKHRERDLKVTILQFYMFYRNIAI